jgi:hypothetical protein
MSRRDLRTNEIEWHSGIHGVTRPQVRIGKPRPIRRANWLGRLVDRLARLLDARKP